MPSIRIVVKPTAGGNKIEKEVDSTLTIHEVKELLAEDASIPATEQRLIFKGQILKDERTVESYGMRCTRSFTAPTQTLGLELLMPVLGCHGDAGIGNDHVLHLVRGKPTGNTQR